MEIRFYQVSVSKNSVKKVFNNSPSIILEGELRSNTSFLKPVIEIAMSDTMYANLTQYNYAYIEVFARYYFIEDMIYTSTKMTEVYLSVDVLSSHWDKIKNETAYIERSSNNSGSLTLKDDRIPLGNETEVREINGTIIDPFFGSAGEGGLMGYNDFNTVVDSLANVVISCTTDIEYSHEAGELGVSHHSNVNTLYVMSYRQALMICHELITNNSWRSGSNLLQFYTTFGEAITDIKIYPFPIIYQDVQGHDRYELNHQDITNNKIRLGNVETGVISDSEGELLGKYYYITGTGPIKKQLGTIDFNVTGAAYFDFSSMFFNRNTVARLFVPYYGFVDIDLSLYYNEVTKRITITGILYCDISNGNCIVNLLNYNNNIIDTFSFDISLSLPIGQSNFYEQDRSRQLAGVKAVINTLSAGINLASGMGISAMSSNPLKVASGMIGSASQFAGNLLTNMGNYITEMEEHSKVSVNSEKVDSGNVAKGYLLPKYTTKPGDPLTTWVPIRLKLYVYAPRPTIISVSDYNNYYRLNGAPTKRFITLSSLNGYTKIGYMQLNTDGMYRDENDELYLILQSGIFINTNT